MCIISNPSVNSNWSYSPNVKIGDFLSSVILNFDGWPWKIIWHLFYTASDFVHCFKAMGELKLELQSGNAQLGSKSATYCAVWSWNLTDDLEKEKDTSSILRQVLCFILKPWLNSNWIYSPETPNSGQNRRLFVPCNIEIWQMTLKNNRAPLLYYVKLCVSFPTYEWIETGVTLWKRSIQIKKNNFCPVWPCIFSSTHSLWFDHRKLRKVTMYVSKFGCSFSYENDKFIIIIQISPVTPF